MSMRRAILILAAALTLAVAGCGSDDNGGGGGGSSSTPASSTPASSSGGGGGTLAVKADPGGALKFTKTSYTAKAGKVTVDFDNPASIPHAVEIEGNGTEVETDVVTSGKASVDADLKAGTYELYCPVGNHRAQGMEAELTVE
jgi:plastocyanin